jgi:hypothetical protein
VVGASAAVLALASCGSTVASRGPQQQSVHAAAGNEGLEAPAQSSSAVVRGGAIAAGPGSAISPAAPEPGAHAPSAVVAKHPGSANELNTTGLPPGVTATSVNVGVIYVTNGGAENAALGGAGITQGDEKQDWTILINDANAHGGVLGRKIVPVFFTEDATTTQTAAEQEQAACSYWTQDHKVFAVAATLDDTGLECLFRNDVSAVYAENVTGDDDSVYHRFPNFVDVGMPSLDRAAKAEVASLMRQRYFEPRATLGILTWDYPGFNRMLNNSLLPALRAAGHPPKDVERVSFPQSNSELAKSGSDVANAMLKFRSDGVDHILIMDASGDLTFLALNQAESQHYYPRYGFNSYNAVEALAGPGDIPRDQLQGSLGIGWWPILDLAPADNPDNGPYSNVARQRCIKLYNRHGVTFSDANAEGVGLLICDKVWFLQAAMDKSQRLTSTGFIDGVDSLGATFTDGLTIGTYFDATHHSGASLYRDWAYVASCGCMRYTSAGSRMP